MKEHLCLIPARSGSKRIPNKNFKDWFGNPIISHVISTAHQTNLFNEVYLILDKDFDQANIAKIGQLKWDSVCKYIRHPETATDEATTFAVFKEFLDVVPQNKEYKYCCIFYPGGVLATDEQIKQGFIKLRDEKLDVVFPVVDANITENKILKVYGNDIYSQIDHDEEDRGHWNVYYHCGAWFWVDIERTLKAESIVCQKKKGIIKLKDYQAQDINTLEDWESAEVKWKLRNLK